MQGCEILFIFFFLHFFSVFITRNNIFQLLDQPKSCGRAALKGFRACRSSRETGICEQLHTPTLTIPVGPGPGPDLIQVQINPQPFQWGCEISLWLVVLAELWQVGTCQESCVMDGVNTRIAHSHYVTCCFREGFTKGSGLHGSLCAITEILCQVHPC